MRLPLLLAALLPLASASSPPDPQYLSSNPPSPSSFKIPTIHQSAIQARRILHLSSIATLSTIFPRSSSTLDRHRPQNLGGNPIGLMEYYASCAPFPQDPTILAVSIATSFRNTAAGSNITLSLRYHPPASHPPSDDIYTYSPANLPRFSLLGYIEPIPTEQVETYNISGCFLEHHPDAELWTPGNDIHESWWARLVVEEVYWFGGFGDRAYIGWIPVEEWRGVTTEEVERCRLVGEENELEELGGGDMWVDEEKNGQQRLGREFKGRSRARFV